MARMGCKWKRWAILALMLLTLGLIIACQNNASTIHSESRGLDCTPINHAAGTTCVPYSFERLVTLDSVAFENAIALGLHPVATVVSSLSSHLSDYLDGVENIGQQGEPNLESVLVLNPDLILGLDFHQSIYDQTSQIAPTALFEFEHSGQWKEVFQTIGDALGKADSVQQAMDDYYQRIEEFKAAMGELGDTRSAQINQRPLSVSVVRIYPDSITLYLRDSFSGTVLQDAGLSRPASQNLSADEGQRIAKNPIQIAISRELLPQADADVMFIWVAENEAESNQNALRKLEDLQTDSLWKQLNAVQQNRVYIVPSYWIGSGPIAANLIIDDLFKYLLKEPSA